MPNPDHLAILEQGAAAWNQWRDEHPEERPDLSGADLIGADLNGANLNGANLRNADLSGADLREADLREADLYKADLSGAGLSGADLREARLGETNLSDTDLYKANLSKANIFKVDLSRANLRGADLTGSEVGWCSFVDHDLRTVKGLDTVRHDGPSGIGIDTIYKSGGNIPEVFLRGAGVPENFIRYIGSLVGTPIQFYSCFISYSTKDQDFADRLYADMQAKGIRCWFAPHDIQAGKKVHEQIDEAIRLHEKLLLILSPASMQSEWVKTEIAKARKREVKEEKRLLFPVRLVEFETLRDWECFDGDTGKDSAREIREYHIPDFSQWKEHDLYQKAFDMLLRDLKAEAAKT